MRSRVAAPAEPVGEDDSTHDDQQTPSSSSSNNNNAAVKRVKELPLLPIRKRVLLPGGLLRLTIGRPKSVRLVDALWDAPNRTFKKGALVLIAGVVVAGGDEGGVGKQEDEAAAEGQREDKVALNDPALKRFPLPGGTVVYEFGTAAKVLQLSRVQPQPGKDGTPSSTSTTWSMLVEGVARVRATGVLSDEPFYVAKVDWPATRIPATDENEIRALAIHVKRSSRELLEQLRKRNTALGSRTKDVLETVDKANPEHLADVLTSANGDATMREKQAVLGELGLASRLRKSLELLNRQIEVLQISDKIQSSVEGKLKTSQREYYLRQQLKAINDELGSLNGKTGSDGEPVDEIAALETSLKAAILPTEARTAADREMTRLKNMQPSQPEYAVLRTYLEWIADLPWGKSTVDNLDVSHAQRQLDDDHFGLEKVKRRMLEFLAVRSLTKDSKGPILCLVGPPGVGKTSLGRSVAQSLGRKFRRLALGGVRDEAEVRGHRRTYIGALPGNIIQAMKKAGSDNPVVLLDEVDKLGRDVRGDPGAALLEVLDPEQNSTFTDHYLNIPFDLSKVMFIATANDVSTIPAPLLDRMELIEVPGYSMHEKIQIAMRHLVPKQMERHGITEEHVKFSEQSIQTVLEGYTREAGVRNLDREIAALCRHVAVRVAEARDRYVALHPPVKPVEQAAAATGDQVEVVVEDVPAAVPATAPAVGPKDPKNPPLIALATPAAPAAPAEPAPLLLADFECIVLTPDVVRGFLGPVRFENEVANRVSVPGVATGMAWTSVGGEILFVEVAIHRGSGRVQLTGRLGETMQESVKTAMSYVRSHVVELGLETQHRDRFTSSVDHLDLERALRYADLHVHFPSGGTPKDGPSAGVAITAALVSALSGLCVRPDTSCTGEVTLRGLVLPVGGIKEKVLAAHRAGIRRVVLPERNRKDVADIPKSVQDELTFIFASNIPEAMQGLFDPDVKARPPAWRVRVADALKEERLRSKRQNKLANATDDEDDLHANESNGAAIAAHQARDTSVEILASKL